MDRIDEKDDQVTEEELGFEEDNRLTPEQVEELLKEKEVEVTKAVKCEMNKEIEFLRQRCEFILQNEQVRVSFMLREAHRERQEKIHALQKQLECKNLAGLMYVMCSERNRSKMDRLRLTEEYTNYILALQDILSDAQKLILNLSRGYKTAARVDREWRDKMRIVLFEFQSYINDFTGGTSETNQYFLDLPKLLKTTTPTTDNPEEDPCEDEEQEEPVDKESETEKPWWERMGDKNRPFLIYGDMAEFKAPERREVLSRLKAVKTAPRKWKEYMFDQMFLSSFCNNAHDIKDEYPIRVCNDIMWECPVAAADAANASKMSIATSRRGTRASEDMRGKMGSILKIISASVNAVNVEKLAILAARDSIEIVSATKLRTSVARPEGTNGKVSIKVGDGSRRQSSFNEEREEAAKERELKERNEDEEELSSLNNMKLKKTDSKEVIKKHKRDVDHIIHYEKVCPMEKCQRLKHDSFIRSLPPYMRANPFTHFEQNYEDYETCSPEQLAILTQRIAEKKTHNMQEECPLKEWTPSVDGIAVQTSDISMTLPPCNCRDPFNTPASSRGMVFNLADLIPVKQKLDTINKENLYDNDIQFNRFKVIGQTDSTNTIKKSADTQDRKRIQEITQILKQHPSLLDIF